MRAENGLIAVGGADNNLHICSEKLRAEGFTQAVVDKCIMEEMSQFLGTILTQELINSHAQSNETISTMEDTVHVRIKYYLKPEIDLLILNTFSACCYKEKACSKYTSGIQKTITIRRSKYCLH